LCDISLLSARKDFVTMGWPKHLSIRTRLNILVGTLLVLALVTNVLAIIWSAGPRIRAEDESIVRLTRRAVESGLAALPPTGDQEAALAALIEPLNGLRHVNVYRELSSSGPALPPPQADPAVGRVPDWFIRLLGHDRPFIKVKVPSIGAAAGFVVIESSPSDEISEIWEAMTETLTGGLALIGAVFALTSFAVHQALAPIDKLSEGLKQLQGGDYEVRVPMAGPPELADISAKLNTLAAALKRTRSDNARLAEQIIWVEDDERRELARELHDEFGPYLFSIRATLTALLSDAQRDGATDRMLKCTNLLDQVSEVQQLNRRVLQRLRPPALSELGLDGALLGLVTGWRTSHPHVTITLETAGLDSHIGETTSLTVYRVVQEGLTNALRHAGASLIAITVIPYTPVTLTVRVADNGSGISEANKPGFGLSGMSERVWALGGTMTVSNGPIGGLMLQAELPLSTSVDAD
jgi:two-component system, NarL family, sensor histidine kinase UhpB